MTNHIGIVYAETENELSGPIISGVVYVKKQSGQQLDQSYKYGLHQKQNWVVMTDRIGYGL